MARLGRSFPVNWQFRRPRTSLAIPAAASMAAGFSLTAGASVTGSAVLAEITNIGPVSIPPATGELDAAFTVTAGGAIVQNALLPVATGVTGVPSAWQYIGPVPLTYLQYVAGAQVLAVTPGEAFAGMNPASGLQHTLPVPPPDGRWITLGGGGGRWASVPAGAVPGSLLPGLGQLGLAGNFQYFVPGSARLADPAAVEHDELAWDPPAPLAHLPVPFDVIRKRIQARRRGVVV